MTTNMNLKQVYDINAATVIGPNDLMYILQSPFTPGTDAGIDGTKFGNIFQQNSYNYGVATGLTNVSALTLSPVPSGYTDGMIIYVKANHTNTGAATINVNTLGNIPINTPGFNALIGGEMIVNQTYQLIYNSNGNVFVLNESSIVTLTGDVTGSGNPNNIATTISNNVVTYAKMQQANTVTLLGNPTGILANISEITLGSGLSFVGTTLTATASTSPLTTKGDIWVYSTINTRLPVGTVNGQVLQVNSGDAIGLAYSTATYPATTTANRILYSSATNTISEITSANNGVLVTDNTGVPSILNGSATSNQALLSNNAAAPGWSAYTFPASITANSLLYGSASNVIGNLTTQNNGLLVTSNVGAPSILAGPGTTGNVLQSNAAAAPSFSTATYPSVATGTGTILRANGTNWIASTATFADTYTASNLLYSNGANTVTGLATANNGVLITSAGGVPSISSTLPSGLTIPGYALSGANADITSMTGLTGYLQAPTGIKDANGNIVVLYGSVASAVNYISLSNNATGQNPNITATGSDPSVNLILMSKNGDFWLQDGSSTIAPALRFYNAAGDKFTGLKVADAQASNLTLTLPAADAAVSGNALVSNASGVLSFLTLPTLTKVVYQIFTSGTGTYTPTSGMKYCIIECVGAGGAGGGAAAAGAGAGTGGGGGGGGSYSCIIATAATIGASQSYAVGTGGTAGTAGNNPGNNGGDSSIGSICIGKGGTGGTGSAGAPGGAGGAGGIAGTGTLTTVGGTGGHGVYGGATTIMPQGGQGGSTVFGVGAPITVNNAATTGNTSQIIGGGGSGGISYNNSGTVAGGAGGNGYIRITEFISI